MRRPWLLLLLAVLAACSCFAARPKIRRPHPQGPAAAAPARPVRELRREAPRAAAPETRPVRARREAQAGGQPSQVLAAKQQQEAAGNDKPKLEAAVNRAKAHAALTRQLEVLGSKVLPRREEQVRKQRIREELEELCQYVLGNHVQVFPFGSSVNGCGERRSDLDMVLAEPDCSCNRQMKRQAVQSLRSVGQVLLTLQDYEVEALRASAKVPILMITKDGCEIDLSYGNLLPLLNTRLLRSYSLLNPQLAVLAAAVKRWAKSHGIAKTFDGFISSYAWTLMVVYYLQVFEQLPVLHRQGFGGLVATDVKTMEEVQWHGEAKDLGELLLGFFNFYANDFDWGSEVVSVRLGLRRSVHSREYKRLEKSSRSRASLHIEDPIDITKDLNFALRRSHGQNMVALRFEIDSAWQQLAAGASLSVLGIALPDGEAHDWQASVKEGFVKLGDVGQSLMQTCDRCGLSYPLAEIHEHRRGCRAGSRDFCCGTCSKCFRTLLDLEQHQVATGHDGEPRSEGQRRRSSATTRSTRRRKYLRD